jgi:hypothetical protein
MRQLLWFIAGVSTLLAGIVSANGVTAFALLMAALIVTAHVFSTALGSRLRSDADQSLIWDAERSRNNCDRAVAPATRSPWHGRGSTALPWLPGVIVAGAAVGGFAGAILLLLTIGTHTSPAGVAVGSISLAVLGGWVAFLGGSFYGIFRHGLRDALSEQQKDEASPRLPR